MSREMARLKISAQTETWRRGYNFACRAIEQQVEHLIDHCEPPFIADLKTERETWIADNMRHEILTKVRDFFRAL
jgi:hypothetical protein